MTATDKVENLVLGGGEAGKYIVWELAGQGRPTVVVERAMIGSSCPNIACLPSKNVILTHPTMAEGLNVLLAGVPP